MKCLVNIELTDSAALKGVIKMIKNVSYVSIIFLVATKNEK